MFEINNKHIVLMLLIVIIGVFIYNYDVYVIPKDEPLCKPVFVTKRELDSEIRAELNRTESETLKETFNNLADIEYFETFGNSDITNESTQYDIPPKSFSSFSIPSLTTQHKIKVIDSVVKILSYIPTNYSENEIKQMIEYFGIIYETSPDLETFYKNVASSTKIKEPPYNSKYSHLILFLIGKFDNDYLSYSNTKSSDEKCAINELLKEIISKNNDSSMIDMKKNPDSSDNRGMFSENLSKQINTAIDTQANFNPKEVLNIIEKTKNNPNQIMQTNSNVILPELSKSKSKPNSNSNSSILNPIYMEKQQQSDSNFSLNPNSNLAKKQPKNKKCNKTKCTYKCDSSYSNAMSYLDSELKPLESFGNIYEDYAII
jgi:hypothetical protein